MRKMEMEKRDAERIKRMEQELREKHAANVIKRKKAEARIQQALENNAQVMRSKRQAFENKEAEAEARRRELEVVSEHIFHSLAADTVAEKSPSLISWACSSERGLVSVGLACTRNLAQTRATLCVHPWLQIHACEEAAKHKEEHRLKDLDARTSVIKCK